MPCSVELVSAVPQWDSAACCVCVRTLSLAPPSCPPPSPGRRRARAWRGALPQPRSCVPHPWAWCLSALLSPLVPVSTRLFFTPVSLFLPYAASSIPFLYILNILGFFFFPFRSKDHWVYYTIPVIQLLEEVKRSNLNLKFIDWTCLYILTTFNNNSKKSLITTQIQTAEIPTTNRTKPLFPPHNRV